MNPPETDAAATANPADDKPRDEEIDVFGLTHPGKVRQNNQDHFLMCSIHKSLDVHFTSLPDMDHLPLKSQRLAVLAVVADGVGGEAGGAEASRLAVETVAEYVANSMHCYYEAGSSEEAVFAEELQNAAMRCHASVLDKAEEDPELRRMATTLTLWLSVWPRLYLLQVGDSRCYLFREGTLTQITRDQTMAQELVDQGVLTRTDAFSTQWAHVLSSSIGGSQTAPVVTQIDMGWHDVGLLCSDGLTKHVSDERIGERLAAMTSAKQVCEDLLQDALDDGGTDNITVIVGRSVRRRQ